jgi:hypothetical protein
MVSVYPVHQFANVSDLVLTFRNLSTATYEPSKRFRPYHLTSLRRPGRLAPLSIVLQSRGHISE